MNNALDSSHGWPSAGQIQTVFLDRDGVVNEKMPEGSYVTRWEEFHLLPGAAEAIGLLNAAKVRVVVVSNQRGIALGLYTSEAVRDLHAELQKLLATHGAHVDAFYFCPHDKGACDCRKPLPGMFDQAVAEFPGISAAGSVMIGDSLSDLLFGRRLGMTTVLLESDAGEQRPGAMEARALADLRFASLHAAVTSLMASRSADRIAGGAVCLGLPGSPR